MRERLKRLHERLFCDDLRSLRGVRRVLTHLLRLAAHVGRQWNRHRCPSLASALSFETALSLVPSLAVAFALLKATGALEARSALVEFISSTMFPVYGERVGQVLVQFADNINAGVLGAVGVIATFIIAYFVFHEVEHIFNDIWKVTQRRSLLNKAVIFYTLLTLVPFFVSLSLYHTIYHAARTWRLGGSILGWLAPTALVWVALLLANRLLPRAKVKWTAAAIGALLSAVLFELMKRAFALYLADLFFRRYTGIYGALALLPLLLMWIYLAWLVVLLGAEVAYAVQNFWALETLERRARPEWPHDHVNGVVATRIMLEIARAFRDGERAVSTIDLAARFELAQEVVSAIVDRLRNASLLMEIEGDASGITLARSPDGITVEQVMSCFRPVDVRAQAGQAEKLNRLLREMEQSRRAAGAVSLADLLEQPPRDA